MARSGLEAALKRISKRAMQYEYQMKELEVNFSPYKLPQTRYMCRLSGKAIGKLEQFSRTR
jgi:hypothetical protein